MNINADGIVLRQRKIANNRRMIVLFTRQYGKISAGTSLNERSRSKSALALRPFTYAEYDIFKGREAYSINSASVLHSYYSIGEDIGRYMSSSAFLEYLEKVLEEGVPMTALFKLSLEFLDSVSRSKSSSNTLLMAFIVKSLRMLGVMPELGCCANCGKDAAEIPVPAGFSVAAGGIICRDCTEGSPEGMSSLLYKPRFDIISVLRYFESQPLASFEKINLKKEDSETVREILGKYTEQYLDVNVLDRYR